MAVEPSLSEATAQFWVGLKRFALRCGCLTGRRGSLSLSELGAEVNKAPSTLSELFNGKHQGPPDDKVVTALLDHCAPSLQARGESPAEAMRTWQRRCASLITQHERAAPLGISRRKPLDGVLRGPDVGFIGRDHYRRELSNLLRAWVDGDGATRSSSAVALVGTAGVGKTALVRQWAFDEKGLFTENPVFIDLQGYGAAKPLSPTTAIAEILHQLGLSASEIPSGLRDRQDAFYDLLSAGRRLIILDNALDSAQLKPLLPPASTHAFVVVTSRNALAEAIANGPLRRVEIQLMSDSESLDLLALHSQRGRDEESGNLLRIAHLCANLPLAMRIAAEVVSAAPERDLPEIVAEMYGSETLSWLESNDDTNSPGLARVFSWSYQKLDPEAARYFRALGELYRLRALHEDAVLAYLGVKNQQGISILRNLKRAHLIELLPGRQVSAHDLLRNYAQRLAAGTAGETSVAQRRAAATRLRTYYEVTLTKAARMATPDEPGLPTTPNPLPRYVRESFSDRNGAVRWMHSELSNVSELIRQASPGKYSLFICRTAIAAYRALDSAGSYAELLNMLEAAKREALSLQLRGRIDTREDHILSRHIAATYERMGESREAARFLIGLLENQESPLDSYMRQYVLTSLGLALYRLGRNQEAFNALSEVADAPIGEVDEHRRAVAQRNRAFAGWRLGLYEQASEDIEQSYNFARTSKDKVLHAYTATNLGLALWRAGETERAFKLQRESLAVASADHVLPVEVYALTNTGLLEWRQQSYLEAYKSQECAIQRLARLQHRSLQAYLYTNMGLAAWKVGSPVEAIKWLSKARAKALLSEDLGVLAEASNGLGEVYVDLNKSSDAKVRYAEAHEVASSAGDVAEMARAQNGLNRLVDDE